MYPKPAPEVPLGSINGGIHSAATGGGIFGAHVFAGSTSANEAFAAFGIRKTPIGTLSNPDGTYRIDGVPADSYVVTAEPLDDPESTGDVSSFTDAMGGTIQTNFTTRWH